MESGDNRHAEKMFLRFFLSKILVAYMRTEFSIHAKQTSSAEGITPKLPSGQKPGAGGCPHIFSPRTEFNRTAPCFFGWRECCEGDGDGEQHAQRGVKAGVEFCKSAIPYRLEKSYIPEIADSSKGK